VTKKSESQGQTPHSDSAEPGISVYGDFPRRVMHISRTLSSLLIAIGRLEDKEKSSVLVPYVEIKFGGELEGNEADSDDDDESIFSHIVTIDNAAYIIFDMIRDFKIVCEQLSAAASGELKPLRSQIEPVTDYISKARTEIDACLAELAKFTEKLTKSG
jgi:hypothetical protein